MDASGKLAPPPEPEAPPDDGAPPNACPPPAVAAPALLAPPLEAVTPPVAALALPVRTPAAPVPPLPPEGNPVEVVSEVHAGTAHVNAAPRAKYRARSSIRELRTTCGMQQRRGAPREYSSSAASE
ncbi:MAG TPA: hypothetical protein VHU80_15015 [Polyangiaceae bacterium]|nr:hypothetical protein [Polyangiaceae bacterium]